MVNFLIKLDVGFEMIESRIHPHILFWLSCGCSNMHGVLHHDVHITCLWCRELVMIPLCSLFWRKRTNQSCLADLIFKQFLVL